MSFRLSGSIVPTGRRLMGGMADCSAVQVRCPTSSFRETSLASPGRKATKVPRNLTKLGHLAGHSSL